MKNKSVIFAILAIFLLTCGIASVYAQQATAGSLTFDVPAGLTIESSNDTGVTLTNTHNTKMIIDSKINTKELATSYLEGQGYSYVGSAPGSIDYEQNGEPMGTFSYEELQFKKDGMFSSESAYAYVFDKDGSECVIIAIPDSSFDGSTSLIWSGEGMGIMGLISNICV